MNNQKQTLYRVWDDGKVKPEEGQFATAKEILKGILESHKKNNTELEKMDVDKYAKTLIADAPYFIPKDLFEALKRETADTYDRALMYLSKMPESRVRILRSERQTN